MLISLAVAVDCFKLFSLSKGGVHSLSGTEPLLLSVGNLGCSEETVFDEEAGAAVGTELLSRYSFDCIASNNRFTKG